MKPLKITNKWYEERTREQLHLLSAITHLCWPWEVEESVNRFFTGH